MKEKEFKHLMKKASIETSEDFMDQLNARLEREVSKPKEVVRLDWRILITGFALVLIGALFFMREIDLGSFSLENQKLPILIIFTVFMLFAIQRYLSLKSEYQSERKNLL